MCLVSALTTEGREGVNADTQAVGLFVGLGPTR